MKTSIKVLVLFGMCAFVSLTDAATTTFDLRTPPKASSSRRLSSSAGSCLQTATFPAGVTATGALSVGDTLAFLLFEDTEIRVTLSERMESPLGGEAFIGTVSGYDGVKNAVVLQTAEGLMVDIQDFARSRTYTIVSDSSGVTVKEIDPSREIVTPTEPVDPGILSGRSGTRLSATPRLQADQATTLVDVLVAYDTPAASWARQNGGGITNFATMAVQKMNTVLDNCGFATTFRYRLVGVMTVNATGGTDLDGVLSATKNGTGNWAPIKVMRDTVGADIVTTLIDTGSASGNTGLGYSLNTTPLSSFSESAYNVCAVRAVANGHTMTHEVGHNIGAGHATAVNPDQITPGPQLYDYSAGYYFTGTDGVAYHTIMAYNFDGYGNTYSPAPFFSSPNFTYQGTPVGDATHDNVRTIQQTYSAASQWRAQKVPMSYDVYFSPEGGATFTDSITVTLTPGKAGLPIRYTLDGSMPTTSSTLYTGPITLTQTTTIRAITVTDGNPGPVFEATYSVSDLGNGLDAPQLNWRTSETSPWAFQTGETYDGVDAVRSTDNGAYWSSDAWLETTVIGPTDMSFRYKMKTGRGTFSVLIDNTEQFSDTREAVYSDDWHLEEVHIPVGSHTVRFLFEMKGSRYPDFNGAWLDTVQFDALSRPPTISPTTTPYESTAYTFQGSQAITITPPAGRQGVLYYTTDGSDPTGESQLVYEGPITITKSTRIRAVFVEGGKEPSAEVGGLYLERHPVSPGEWTTNVEGAKTAAAQNGRLIAVLMASRKTCSYSRSFYTISESPEFLAWAKANGIYLVTGDTSCHVDAATANDWFWDLCYAYTGDYSTAYPQMYFVIPNAPTVPINQGLARNDGYSLVGTELYLDTVESLIAGFASILGETVPQAPGCSHTEALVDGFPLTVTFANPNGSGTIYYTLDGSAPTPSNGTIYSGAITITSTASTLSAAVWPASGLSSPVYVGAFKTVADVFGTSDVAWTRSSGTGSWRIDTSSLRTLRVGGLRSGTYTATLQATVSGKGKLVFMYKVVSWTSNNRFTFSVNGTQQVSCAYNGTDIFSGTVVNEVASDTTTTYTWTYKVENASFDYPQTGVWLSDVQWIPEGQEDAVVVNGVSVPYTWLDGHYPNQGGSAAAYEALANADSDGDGFPAWQEYLLGTDPTNAVSHLSATVTMNGNTPVFGWSHTNANIQAIGYRYVPKGCNSLNDSAGWQPFTPGHRFFKVVVEPIE